MPRGSEIEESLSRHGLRPIERLETLGLLTPALTAAHMVHLSAADLELAQRRGIGVTLCLASDLLRGAGVARVADLAAAGLRLSLGSDGDGCRNDQDVWTEMKLNHGAACRAGPDRLGRPRRRHSRQRGSARTGRRRGHPRTRQVGGCLLRRSRRTGHSAAERSDTIGFLRRPRSGERCVGGRPTAAARRRIDPFGLEPRGRARQ